MNPVTFVLAAIAVCIVWAMVSLIRITAYLDRRGEKTPFVFMGALMFRNLNRYKTRTQKEAGKPGPLYLSFVIPVNAALILALAVLILGAIR